MDLNRNRGRFGNDIFCDVIDVETVNQLIHVLHGATMFSVGVVDYFLELQFPWNRRLPSCQMQMLEWFFPSVEEPEPYASTTLVQPRVSVVHELCVFSNEGLTNVTLANTT